MIKRYCFFVRSKKLSTLLLLSIFFLFDLINAQDVEFTSSNLPIIIIDTDGAEIQNNTKITAHMGIIDNGSGNRNNISDSWNDYDGNIGIEIRGVTSAFYPKKQYGIETRDIKGENLNVSLLHFPEENDWILYAPYSDKSLMRNFITYETIRSTGRYASRAKYCELVLNDVYEGIYILLEKVKQDRERVDLTAPSDTSLSGGYLLEMLISERLTPGDVHFEGSRSNRHFVIKYPRKENLSDSQKNWITTHIQEFENVMYSNSYLDPVIGINKYIDMPSFVDYVIFNEAFKNDDVFYTSTFLSKDMDQKIKMGPAWDFNIALGNHWGFPGTTTNWLIFSKNWVNRMRSDPFFQFHYQQRWGQLRLHQFNTDSLIHKIDQTYYLLNEAQERNFVRWPILGEYVSPNRLPSGAGPGEYYETYLEEVNYLKEWITSRLNWMDNDLFLSTSHLIPNLVINEIHYNPAQIQGLDEDYEFIEIVNTGINQIDLSGFYFTHGISFTFPQGSTIAPNQYILIAHNNLIYKGNDYHVYEWSEGNLSNSGGELSLYSADDNLIDNVKYNDNGSWPDSTDGLGYSIELINPNLVNDLPDNWATSMLIGGTPGNPNQNTVLNTNHDPIIPDKYLLHQNFPNPFNNKTTIRYQIPKSTRVLIQIYDLNRRLVRQLADQFKESGYHETYWDAKNDLGQVQSSGIYIYKIQTDDYVLSRKLVLIK